ncbi:YlzJ-like family protein [Alkalihalophilus lindianensis]|uniref:YlzJ-like family protein n=1 Tax=Alkalihalophilus lindianensis TaxID=1630542 RepID=A0ABU3XCZ4_9BACI|nr:YlzJ-like family protein [Alkalihalophilus lindianensis]MDV2685487.1 YlzJ-like family protein [Alkalihalophilus lindianensis]
MILYTMMPHDQIFPQDESVYATQQVVNCADGQLIVEQVNASQYKIVRLMSSNPMSYLNPGYSPGTIIQAKPQF